MEVSPSPPRPAKNNKQSPNHSPKQPDSVFILKKDIED